MSDELFEVVFSGQISEGANLQEVKTRIGKMFKADGAQLEQLFSGQSIVIKKNADQQTAHQYKTALQGAGAECDLRSMSADVARSANPAPAASVKAAAAPAPQVAQTAEPATAPTSTAGESSADVPPPPQVDPLGVTGDQINDLAATLAPVGSELQSDFKHIPEPQFDLSAFDMAPVGSTLGEEKKKADPPPPDTSGLTMADW